MPTITTLATDLDGTFIPLGGDPTHIESLQSIQQYLVDHRLQLIFVSGRSWSLTRQAIAESALPEPNVAICDVGTSIMVRQDSGYQINADYSDCLQQRMQGWDNQRVLDAVTALPIEIESQSPDRQTDFKASFDFPLADQTNVRRRVRDWINESGAPLSMVVSKRIDGKVGLMDLLPGDVNKAFALQWWLESKSIALSSVVFCGDSGNDSAVMSIGVNSVLVGNADEHLRESVIDLPSANIYSAKSDSTSGVLEGLLYFSQRS
ncbi:HAD family hydrolase [Stieleria sp. TO1_6]|uniref:HAD-IIB family hydrolase n=1 Tax=Stieleria tagensis TaxID=2956795 RepID=UPI00209B1C4D|nr:HAD-IIB family hydrolase [Stieleria tagensis]MCO8121634.1 HAD family hydrolase [Stieleria tagensis]